MPEIEEPESVSGEIEELELVAPDIEESDQQSIFYIQFHSPESSLCPYVPFDMSDG